MSTKFEEALMEKTPAELKDYLALMLPTSDYVPTIALGPPGIGKTRVIQQLAKELNYKLVESILSIKEPTDVSGIPNVSKCGQYFEYVPERLYYEASTEVDGPPTIMFFDDLPVAHPQTQAAFFKVVDERRVGSVILRDNVKIVAAGNRQGDAAAAHDIPTALANRFSFQKIKVCAKAWLEWATGSGNIHPTVVGYIMKQREPDLHSFDPASSEKAFASPRTWEFVSKHLRTHDAFGRTLDERDIAGLIGPGIASKFKAFLEYGRQAVPIEDIIKDPEGARVPAKNEVDCLFVTISNMIYHIKENPKAWEPFSLYILRDEVSDDIAFMLATHIAKAVLWSDTDDGKKAVDSAIFQRLVVQFRDHIDMGR